MSTQSIGCHIFFLFRQEENYREKEQRDIVQESGEALIVSCKGCCDGE